MGSAIGRRLLDTGFDVTVWNRTAGRAAPLVALGAKEAANPAAAARDAEVVLVSVANDDAARAVLTGPDGALGALGSDAVVADMSTVAPATSRAMADASPGRRFLAAPIAGGPQAVVEGKVVLLVGGPRPLADRLGPLWQDLSSQWRWCGDDPGAATTLKLLNNYLLLGGLALLAEVIATGEAAGLDSALLADFLRNSPLVAPALRNRLDDMVSGDHEGWFSAVLGAKDLGLFARLASEVGADVQVARQVESQFERAAETGWADADVAAVVEVARGRSRTT